jgi:hypothetical protein
VPEPSPSPAPIICADGLTDCSGTCKVRWGGVGMKFACRVHRWGGVRGTSRCCHLAAAHMDGDSDVVLLLKGIS